MSLGFDNETRLVAQGDSVDLLAYLYDSQDNPATADDLASVSFVIQHPDGTSDTTKGIIQDDGGGFLRYTTTSQEGPHPALARFAFVDGRLISARVDFEVFDPFHPPAPTELQLIGDAVWAKLEDCFDASEEGPWLRDVTLNYFNEMKMQDFVNEGLFDLNERNPETHLGITYFFANAPPVPTADIPILIQATFVQVLNHLMRSYTEQPQPAGAASQVGYEDRRDYMQRWGTIYQIEMDKYKTWVALFKRRFLGLGQSPMLVDTKAGRLLPAPLRVRTVGRGYYG